MITMNVTSGKWALVIEASQSQLKRMIGRDIGVTYMETTLRAALRELGIEIEVTE